MPILNWIGKDKVVNHHQDVPYRVLEHKYGFNAEKGQIQAKTKSGNKIIHGDNLEALKSLLPEYEGKIKCIYIDPPYNTGNEGWVYNDNVNDPKINKWINAVVGKEGEDLSRHDKWICMMYPRLKLLHKLLSEDGVIFVSIDDAELYNLKFITDEIFGSNNFLTSFVWKRRASSQLSQNNVSVDHEYVVSYFKNNENKFSGQKKDYKNYSNPDGDPKGPWTPGDLTVGMTKEQRPNQYYDLIDPETGIVYKPSTKRVWTYYPETMYEKIKGGQVLFPKNGKSRPMYKRYLCDLRTDIDPFSSWMSKESYGIGLNSEGTKIIQSMFDHKVFDYPKPVSLVSELINQVCNKDSIVLDSFAGSGTTAHAVMNLNKLDEGNRKFILIEMEDYAENITSERVKRVMQGYGEGSKAVDGTGGSFDFYELGLPIFKEDKNLNEAVGEDKIREYIYYSETKQHLERKRSEKAKYLLDTFNDTSYYFYYELDKMTCLDMDTLSIVSEKAEQYLIYADVCLLDKDYMLEKNIIFKKIPRDIKRF